MRIILYLALGKNSVSAATSGEEAREQYKGHDA